VRRIRTHGATHVADRGGARAIGAWPSSWRAREASDRAPFKRRPRLTCGPLHFFDLLRFSNTHTLIFELVIFLISKFCQML
jgi:hypothetical protein